MQNMRLTNKITFIDLFAGIGGIRLGFEDENTKCVFSSEIDKYACQTYLTNFGEMPHGDITKIEAQDIPSHDVLLAGFPCQPFSKIGKKEGFKHITQGTLFFDIVRIIEYHKPKAFLLENVTGLLINDHGNTIKVIKETLLSLGYDLTVHVLDAADFGLPQHRRRVYIVGFLKELTIKFTPPQGNPLAPQFVNNILEKNVVGYEISKHLQTSYLFKKNDGKPQIIDQESRIKVNTLVASYHKIQRITGTFIKDGATGLRLLTKNECLALQGFPKDFVIPVSRTQMYRQLGNSVAVPVIKAIAQIMKISLRKEKNGCQNKTIMPSISSLLENY